MHDNNRGDRIKTGLIAGIVVAALIAAAFIGWGLWKAAKYEWEASNHAREYAAYTDKKIRQSCIGLAPIKKQECTAQARHEERDYERNERDLAAQRQSALWAYIMGAAAVIGMGLSVIGVFLVWTTFDATRKANAIANDALDGQLRPWIDFTVSLRGLKYEGGTLKPLVAVELFHHGVSPAIDYMFAAKLFTDEFWQSERLYNFMGSMFDDEEVRDGRRTVFPGETWKVYPKLDTPDIPAEAIHATLFVAVQYRSPYSKTPRYTCKVFDIVQRKSGDRLLHLNGAHSLDIAYLGARNERGDFAN